MTHPHPGNYIVANKLHNLHLGRGIHDEEPLLPKEIVTLPGGVRAPIWKLERMNDGRYRLVVSTFPPPPSPDLYVTDIAGKVYGILEGPVRPTEWVMRPVQGHGPNVYIVEAPSGKVWTVLNERPYTQVVLDTIIVLSSGQEGIPYSPTQLFTFQPLLRDIDEDRDD